MSAKTRFWSAFVFCMTELSFEKVRRYKSWVVIGLWWLKTEDTTWLRYRNHTVRLRFTSSYFIKAIDHTLYGFTDVITHLGCRDNTRKVLNTEFSICKFLVCDSGQQANGVKWKRFTSWITPSTTASQPPTTPARFLSKMMMTLLSFKTVFTHLH